MAKKKPAPKPKKKPSKPAPRVAAKPAKPSGPVLSKAELAEAKKKLLAKREDLLREMQRAEEQEKQIDENQEVKDQADLASDAYEREFTSELTDAERRSLQEVDLALERIKAGDYGRCISCGKRIPKIRLDAVPSARLCIECQTQREQRRLR